MSTPRHTAIPSHERPVISLSTVKRSAKSSGSRATPGRNSGEGAWRPLLIGGHHDEQVVELRATEGLLQAAAHPG